MSKNKMWCDTITPKYDYLNKEQNVADYVRYNVNRALAMFHYEGLPETVPQVALEKLLIMNGFAVWAKVNGELYAFYGGLGGPQDVYYMPTIATVANPALNFSGNFEIGKDCVVMPNDSMYMGLLPLFNRYCTLINENDITMLLADVNKRVSFVLSATDDNTADSANLFLQKMFEGKQGVITDNKIMQGLNVNPATQSQMSLMDLVEYQQYLRAGLYNEIGLNSNFNMKRERLTANEVEMNSGNLYPLVDDMLNSRRQALEKINVMFGTEITVEFASSWTMRAEENPVDNVENPVDNVENPADDISRETDPDTPPDEPQDEPGEDIDPPQNTPPDAADEPQDDENREGEEDETL